MIRSLDVALVRLRGYAIARNDHIDILHAGFGAAGHGALVAGDTANDQTVNLEVLKQQGQQRGIERRVLGLQDEIVVL